ncbi:hypothetical protein N9U97_00395 [Candidatus Pelagibacter sp.]|nr:hypothetical protein [Candidatus Pelagibacter sp.]MDA9754422.1 hypothetical protein [Candidatus Pelagibacter sp.]
MSTESLSRTSEVIETPSQTTDENNVVKLDVLKQKSDTLEVQAKVTKVPKRVNIEILKQRLYEEKKKEKVKRTIILSSVIVSLGALTMLTY